MIHHQTLPLANPTGHSWSPIFGRNGQILISLLDLHTVSKLPNTTSLPLPESKPNELETIEFVKGTPRQHGNSLVRVGVAVTNERLRRWCIQNKKVTLPLNVIMVEITLGGSNAPICHGAGRRHQTLSDLVREIEYVDANGKFQTVKDPHQLRAASGCFGLLGVVTRITFELPPMTYARLTPEKKHVVRAVPPPSDLLDKLPEALQLSLAPEERAKDLVEFEKHAADDFYAEWFWFPFSDFAWVNCWNDTTDPTGVVDFPDNVHIFMSFIQTFTMNVLQYTPLLDKLIHAVDLDEAAVTLISRAAMFALPDNKVTTYLPDALHFQRAIQNVRVRDIEVEMPLQPKKGQANVPDFDLARRAWWDAILKVYAWGKEQRKFPMRMPLEMRIMGGSDVVMAPQRGNTLGTCAIEVLTLESCKKDWPAFAQSVLNIWTSYTDEHDRPLDTRPHWAKEWYNYTVNGERWYDKLKNETYAAERLEFKQILAEIGKVQGWTLADLKARFSNDMFDDFYFDDVEPVKGVAKRTAYDISKGIANVATKEIVETSVKIH